MENVHSSRVATAQMADEFTMVTGGVDGVVNVWSLGKRGSRGGGVQHKLLRAMYGHTRPVTVLAISSPYSVVVSGSEVCHCDLLAHVCTNPSL